MKVRDLSETDQIKSEVQASKNRVHVMYIEMEKLSEIQRGVEVMQIQILEPSIMNNCTDNMYASVMSFLELLKNLVKRLEI